MLSNDPLNMIEIVGDVPASDPMTVTIVNNSTVKIGNDFAIDDITLTQNGECEPPCQHVANGVWFNYTGKFTGTGTPALDDTKWHALPAPPGGQHALSAARLRQAVQPRQGQGQGRLVRLEGPGQRPAPPDPQHRTSPSRLRGAGCLIRPS